MGNAELKQVNLDNRTVRRILDAALDLWSRHGYHGASLKDVADAAGVAKSLLHYHFASKEHLLIELQSLYSQKVAQTVREMLAVAAPSPAFALKALDQVFEAVLQQEQHFPFALEVWRASLTNPAVRRRLDAFQQEIRRLFREGVETALGPLKERLAIPPARLAEMLYVAFGGFELHLFLNREPARLKRAYEDFKRLVEMGLLAGLGES
jgi:AcrR family transcriptional regulator